MIKNKDWKLLLQWTLSCLLGFSSGIGLSLAVEKSIGEIISSILFGLIVGLAQWFVLRKRFEVSGWWILATALGTALGFAATNLVHKALLGFREPVVPGILGLTSLGILLGLFQWWSLRRNFHKAGWWVLLSGAAWFMGASITWSVRFQFLEIIKIIADFAVVGIASGVITGLAFFFLPERSMRLEGSKARSMTAVGIALTLIIYASVSEKSGQDQTSWGITPDLGSAPPCGDLPVLDCEDDAYCLEIVPFEPVSGTGYNNYPVNDESWGNQYRSYLRRDLRILIKYAAAKVTCTTAAWNESQVQEIGLGDMSEADGAIPGTSNNDPDHPWGTHQMGNDIDVAYYQNSSQSLLLTMEKSWSGLDGYILRPVCKFTRFGMNVYHCTDLPYLLDPWRTALFIAYLTENPYLRVIGVDGQAGPVLETALDQLVEAGWVDSDLRDQIPLAYETIPEGMGWFKHHHHHLHISMYER